MSFNNIAEAFNHYNSKDISQIERRAKEINEIIDTNPSAEIENLNIELQGLKQAAENHEERKQPIMNNKNFNPLTKMEFEKTEEKEVANTISSTEYRSAFFKKLLDKPLTEIEKRTYDKAISEKRADDFNTVTNAAAKRMSIEAFENYIIEELTSCIMACIADSIVNGTGNEQGTGILTGITWKKTGAGKNHLEFTESLRYHDVTSVVATLKRGYSAGAKWAMNNATLYNLFYGMMDTIGRPIFIADPKNENIEKILGYEVIIDDNLADEVILFGNFNYMGYNISEGIAIEVSRESSFKSGLIDYRAMAIADTKPIITEAFIKLTKAA